MNILTQLRYLLSLVLLCSYIIGVYGSDDDDTLPETCGSVDQYTIPKGPRAPPPLHMNRTRPHVPNPFPFLSLSDKKKMIAEAYPMRDQQTNDSNLICDQTYHIVGNGDSESIAMEFRSQGYPSDAPHNKTSVTCFISPERWKLMMTCEEFAVDCLKSYFGISFDGDLQSPIKKYCGGEFHGPKETIFVKYWTNKLSVVFVTGRGGRKIAAKGVNSSSPSKRFACQVHVTPRKTEPITGDCKCGQRKTELQGRIVGGTAATPHEFPWSCFLFTRSRGSTYIAPECGCSLISQRWVLTTGGCIWREYTEEIFVALGGHELNFTSLHMVTSTAKRVIIHPEYSGIHLRNDIALIELDEPILYNDKVSPICLPWNMTTDDFKGCTVVTSGWGYNERYPLPEVRNSSILNKLNMKVMPNDKCSEYYGFPIEDTLICGFAPGKTSGKEDQGNSMDLQRDGRYYAVGVNAFRHKWNEAPKCLHPGNLLPRLD